MRAVSAGSRRNGFSLLELILALLIFQVGLLGVAGMVLTAQRTLIRAELILRGTLEARRVGDSLLASGEEEDGELEEPWGQLSWEAGGEGYLRVVAMGGRDSDTLAVLRIWLPPKGIAALPDSTVAAGGGGS